MNFLSDEQRLWAEQVDRFMDREIGRDYIRTCDINRDYPYDAYASIAREGWLRLLIPEDHGGLGGTIFDYALMCEGLSKYGFDFATSVMVSTFTAMNVVKFGTDALRYAHERIQFDRPIFDFQVIRHMLADMQTKVDAARLLVYRAAAMATRGQPCGREVSMAKLFASETLQEVTRMGMQVLGGHGMLPEADMERYFREGIQSTIGGGTSQIQRTIIAKEMRL